LKVENVGVLQIAICKKKNSDAADRVPFFIVQMAI